VHVTHVIAEVLLGPSYRVAGTVGRVLHERVERLPRLLEVGLDHLYALPGGEADVIARLALHPREQLLFRKVQVYEHGRLLIEVVACLAEADTL
jgi:hypothetical protein